MATAKKKKAPAKKKEDPGVHIVGVRIDHVHRLRFALLEHLPGTGLIKVTGKNRQGKTGLLNAIRGALGGAGNVAPKAVNDDSPDGTGGTEVDLSNGFTVAKRFTEAAPKGYLKVVAPDEGEHKQGKVDGWTGEIDFDPLSFFSFKVKRQTELLLAAGTDPQLPERLAEIRGDREAAREERRPFNVAVQKAERTAKPPGDRPVPVDVSAEMEHLTELERQRDVRDTALRKADEVLEESQRLDRLADALAAEIEDLEARVKDRQAAEAKRRAEAGEAMKAAAALNEDACTLPYDEEGIEGTRARIAEATEISTALAPWQEYDRIQAEAQQARGKRKEFTEEIKGLDAQEKVALAAAGIPVKGLTFDEEGTPLLFGQPLEVASGRERIEMAAAVAFAHNPELKVCLIDEANDLDDDGLQSLHDEAVARGFQAWICRINADGPGATIVVDDGRAEMAAEKKGGAKAAKKAEQQ